MPDPRGIALSISNRRPVIQDDPEYDKLLLALQAEQPEALQDDELAHLQTLRPPTFRAQNDPAADRARLGMPEDASYASTMGRTLLGGTDAKMSAATKWDQFKMSLGELLHASAGTARGDLQPVIDFAMKPANKKLQAIKEDLLARLPEDTGDRSTFFTSPSVTDPSLLRTRIRNEAGHIVRAATDTARLAAGFVPDTNLDVATFGTAKILGAGLAGAKMLGAAVPFLGTLGDVTQAARALTGGFYSRVDEAAKLLPAKGVKAESLINTLKKAPGGVSAEELEFRKLVEFAGSKRWQTITPADLAAHLEANPAPFPTVKTLGGPSSEYVLRQHGLRSSGIRDYDTDLYRISDGPDAIPLTLDELKQFPQEVMDAFEEVSTGETRTTAPKFSQYQVPGGENYRETLLTLPKGGNALSEAENQRFNYLQHRRTSGARDMMRGPLKDELQALKDKLNPPAEFRSSHFNDPNIVAHTRSNERTSPTGERGTFLEEVQSDWHQQGKEKGYQDPSTVAAMREAEQNFTVARKRRAGEYEKLRDMSDLLGNPNHDDAPPELVQQLLRWKEASKLEDEADDIYRAAWRQTAWRIPDAPFKENWTDLSLKQALIDEANRSTDPGFLGVTGGKTQINRWGTERLAWEPIGKTGYSQRPAFRVSFEPQVGGNAAGGDMGEEALRRGLIQNSSTTVHSLEELTQLLGGSEVKAEKAWKRMMAKPEGGLYQPRAEGMTEFYDKQLPAKLEKIVKPFGGTVEETGLGWVNGFPESRRRSLPDIDENGSFLEPAWYVRLTPEMKARILKEGLPLMGLSGLTLGNLLGQEQEPVR